MHEFSFSDMAMSAEESHAILHLHTEAENSSDIEHAAKRRRLDANQGFHPDQKDAKAGRMQLIDKADQILLKTKDQPAMLTPSECSRINPAKCVTNIQAADKLGLTTSH